MNQPVSAMFALYLERSDFRPATVVFKQRAMAYFVQWFGDLPVGQVQATVAGDYRIMLAKGRSRRSARGYLDNYRPFWRWLLRHGYINHDPFVDVTIKMDEEPLRETFTCAELGAFLCLSLKVE